MDRKEGEGKVEKSLRAKGLAQADTPMLRRSRECVGNEQNLVVRTGRLWLRWREPGRGAVQALGGAGKPPGFEGHSRQRSTQNPENLKRVINFFS